MSIPLPKLSNWKALINSPQTRSMGKASGGFWNELFKSFVNVTGFLFKGIMDHFTGTFSMTKLWQMCVGAGTFVLNFDWNSSDENLLQRLQLAKVAWYSQLGETIGTGIGWLLCGIIPSSVVFAFNEGMGAYILKEVGEEAYDEMLSEVAALIHLGAINKRNEILTHLFIATRWMIKNASNGDGDTLLGGVFTRLLDRFPKLRDAAKKWGSKDGKPWILSQEIEEAIEKVPVGTEWRAFLEELWDSLGDSCVEAGYCFANAFDQYMANQQIVQSAIQGSPNTVVIEPNRLTPDQRIILHGSTQQLKPIINLAIANHLMIDDKNVGYDLGQPLIDVANKMISEFSLVIFTRAKKKPPYGSKTNCRQSQVTINNVPLTKIDYDKIFLKLGGESGYKFGSYYAIAQMNDDSIIKMFADTEQNAINRVEELAELSDSEILTINTGHEINKYNRHKIKGLQKVIVDMFPSYVIILRKQLIQIDFEDAYQNKKVTRKGYYNSSQFKQKLYLGQKPSGWDEMMDLLRQPLAPPTP